MQSDYLTSLPSIPPETARAIVDSFSEENLYIKIGNSLEKILGNLGGTLFEQPLSHTSIPAYVFSLVTVFQYHERLTDDEMAERVRSRPEVRYGLRLAMRYPNISANSLCRYRKLLYENARSFGSFEKIAKRLEEFTLQSANGKNKYSLLESVCLNNRIHQIITSMLEVLETLAATHPNWMREIAPAYWYERYNRSFSKFVKEVLEKGTPEMILEIGNDMRYLLNLAKQEQRLADLAEIGLLTGVFQECFEPSQDGTRLERKPIACTFCSRIN